MPENTTAKTSPEQMEEMRRAFADITSIDDLRPSTLEGGAKFKPYADWIVVIVDPTQKEWRRGDLVLHRTDHIAEWTMKGTVHAVGPGARDDRGVRVPLEVKPGDRVVFDWRPSHEDNAIARLCGERALLLRESELGGFVEEE